MPFTAVKTYLSSAFLKEYKLAYDEQDDSHKEMLNAIKEYIEEKDSNSLYEWIERYLTDNEYIKVPSFASDLFNDMKESMDGYRGIGKEIAEEFENNYCPTHGVRWDKTTTTTKYLCSECEKTEEEEGDVDCECCEGNYTIASCMKVGGKMTCGNCLDECQFSETCKIK
jgi:hypothetical protein